VRGDQALRRAGTADDTINITMTGSGAVARRVPARGVTLDMVARQRLSRQGNCQAADNRRRPEGGVRGGEQVIAGQVIGYGDHRRLSSTSWLGRRNGLRAKLRRAGALRRRRDTPSVHDRRPAWCSRTGSNMAAGMSGASATWLDLPIRHGPNDRQGRPAPPECDDLAVAARRFG